MYDIVGYIFFLLGTYLLGSIPFSYILVRIMLNIDIRTVGSGNAGATNAGRVLGKWGFLTIVILDMLKGYLPVVVSIMMIDTLWYALPVAFAAVLGHTYSPFLKFKGGKGVATTGGVCLALVPLPTLIALIVFLIVFAIKRIVSLGSIIGAIALVISTIVLDKNIPLIVFTTLLSVLVIYNHRDNIKRILAGSEKRVSREDND